MNDLMCRNVRTVKISDLVIRLDCVFLHHFGKPTFTFGTQIFELIFVALKRALIRTAQYVDQRFSDSANSIQAIKVSVIKASNFDSKSFKLGLS